MRGRNRGLTVAVLSVLAVGGYGLAHPPGALGSVTASVLPGDAATTRPAGSGDQAATREVFSPDGSIRRTRIRDPRIAPSAEPKAQLLVTADVVTIQQSGATDARFDLVFLGDGYTAGEMGRYHDQVVARWNQLAAVEPFRTLKDKFNVWQVNVVSRESGSDNDPNQGVTRDTALDSGFWCGGLDRLLCVNQTATRQYAALAPAVDQILVLVNSTTYGGSGGESAVSSGGNADSGGIAIHELGHYIGGLADEYGGDGTYTGAEPTEPNVSRSSAQTMRSQQTKWYQDLGAQTPDGGVIGTFEGARYYDHGLFRPSADSMMRSLGKPFNLVSTRALTNRIMTRVH